MDFTKSLTQGKHLPLNTASSNPTDYLTRAKTDLLAPSWQFSSPSLNSNDSLTKRAVAFFDASVADFKTLVADVKKGIEVYILNPAQNEIQQIDQVLAGRTNISSLSIVSHGSDAHLQLGKTSLNIGDLSNYRSDLTSWSKSLAKDADIFLYGCDVAQSDSGKEFVRQIGKLTGATVAASTDLTGSAALGGNWKLEFSTGNIGTPEIFNPKVEEDYHRVLANFIVTNTNDGDTGSLREAINGANQSTDSSSTITFDSTFSASQTIHLSTAGYDANPSAFLISKAITIDGGSSGVTIDQTNATGMRLFYVDTAGSLTLKNMTVSKGLAADDGGGIFINGSGAVTLNNSTINGNSANDDGGGISNSSGTLTVNNSTISGNIAKQFNVTILTQNTVNQAGGGIYNSNGKVTVSNSTISGNIAAYGGGGTYNDTGTMIVSNSTVSKNTANSDGGGIYDSSGTVTVSNSTISDNTAAYGGGIFDSTDKLKLSNSLVGRNINSGGDVYGSVDISSSYNLIGNGSNMTGITNGTQGNQIGTFTTPIDPKLGTLGNNGGSTKTIALLTGSPAINAGDPSITTPDQRGFARVGLADIGAFEYYSNYAPVLNSTAVNPFTSILENNLSSSNTGTLVSTLLNSAVTDLDPNSLQGIAVTNLEISNGTWQYSSDNGNSWTTFNTVSNNSAFLLAADSMTRVRFQPNTNYNGKATIMFRAWDQTSGSAGSTADTSMNDGITPFSKDIATTSIIVTPVNHNPTSNNVFNSSQQSQFFSADGVKPLAFNESLYLSFNPDVAQAVKQGAFKSGYEHFIKYGQAEGRGALMESVANLFDEAYYLKNNADVAKAVQQGLFKSGYEHFIQFGQLEGRDPSQLFNNNTYLAQNQDVAQAIKQGTCRSAFDHFIHYGEFEGRNPSSLFDNNTYLKQNADVYQAVAKNQFRSGVEHFIRYGLAEGRVSGIDLFDEQFYLAHNQDVAQAVVNGTLHSGFEHFILYGQKENRQPSSLFNDKSYLAANSDVAQAVAKGSFRSGFEHYVLFGRLEGRAGITIS